MTKVLLSNTNTIWGVIAKPQSSNVYRHVLSFETDALKEKFIDDKLFGGKSFKTLLNNSKPLSFAIESALNCSFKIDPKDYVNETMESLMNKDFAIVDNNGKISYYAIISATRVGQMVLFVGELDIFFTNDIKNMFNDKPTQIERGMIDRVIKENNQYIFTTESKQEKWKNSLYNVEPIDNASDDNLVPTKYEVINEDILNAILPITNDNDNTERDRIASIVLAQKWSVIYRSIGNGGRISDITYFNNNTQESHYSFAINKDGFKGTYLPYSAFIAPITLSLDTNVIIDKVFFAFAKTQVDYDNGKTEQDYDASPLVSLDSFSKPLVETPDVIQNTYSVLSTSIFNMLNRWPSDSYYISKKDNGSIWVVFKSFDSSLIASNAIFPVEYSYNQHGVDENQPPDTFEHFFLCRMLDADISKRTSSIPTKLKPLPDFIDWKDSFDITKKVNNYDTEIKSYFAPYRKLKLRHSTKLEKVLIAQNFNKNQITLKQQYSLIPELWNHIAQVDEYNNIEFNNALPPESQEHFEDASPYGFPTEQNAYQEYIVSHRSQMTAGLFSNVAGSALGFAGSMVAENPIGAIGSITSAISSIANYYALQKDLQRTPLKINQTSSTLTRDLSYKDFRMNITEYQLPHNILLQIKKFFYVYGYNINHKLDNINDYLDSRYYFNYIQAPQTFENMKLQASSEIKQIINDTLASGVHIWHVRDINSFNGIKNYEYENVEQSYIESVTNDNKK